ncbi:MAG: sugar phosphate isomerase/epimerase [Desulfuromonadales bacterium]|nr:sugar phosphate isomerase/epimerase [Desulfuromonadales bacterium]
MNSTIHAHVPYLRLFENMEYILRERINPEIYFSSEALDTFTHERLSTSARLLRDAGLATTIHAAFMDLNPGALDATIRDATRKRFEQVFQAAEILKPRIIVVHPGLDEVRHGNERKPWLENSIRFWRDFLPRATDIGCTIAVENIFEKEPSSLRDLLEAIDDPALRHCFDVGHWNMFASTGLEEWFTEMGSHMAEIHLHDNHGQTDEHLPLGEGQINFDLLFNLVRRFAPEAVWTIEAHSNERLERALENIKKYL